MMSRHYRKLAGWLIPGALTLQFAGCLGADPAFFIGASVTNAFVGTLVASVTNAFLASIAQGA